MLPNQAYAAYKDNKILTASPAELTLMLYEGAIKFCNVAIMAIEKGDIGLDFPESPFPDGITQHFSCSFLNSALIPS